MRICGDKLKQLRQAAGLSQAALGARAGVSARTIRHSEQGRHVPQISNLKAIADALGVPLSALGASARRPVGAVPPAPPLLIGRQSVLQRIRDRLTGGPGPSIVAIHGWPGVGKTTLSAAIAHDREIARMFPSGILWWSLGPAPDIRECLMAWAEIQGLSVDRRQPPSPLELARQLAFTLKDSRALLIIDDAWSIDSVEALRVLGSQCAMIVTTRMPLVADQVAGETNVFRLEVLSRSDAFALLANVVPSVASSHPIELREVADEVEGLPLALHVAAGLLRAETRRGFPLGELLDSLRSSGRGSRHILEASVPGDLLRYTTPSVAALLARSTDILDPVLRDRFALLGLFTAKPARFDEPAVSALWENSDVRLHLGELADRGLVEPIPDAQYQIHALLKVHAEALLEA